MEDMKKIAEKQIKKQIKTIILNAIGSFLVTILPYIGIIILAIVVLVILGQIASAIGIDFDILKSEQPTSSVASGVSSTNVFRTITGDTYYISATGSDTNSGTTASEPLASFDEAFKKLKPGDGLIIASGTYTKHLTINKQGESGKPIIIRADGEVVFDGKGGGGTLLKVSSDAKYVNIEGITFKNLKALETRAIYLEHSCNNINILDCKFEDIKANPSTSEDSAGNAIYFEGSGSTREHAINNIVVQNCTMKNICAGYSEGISIDGNCTNIILDGITATAPDVKSNIAICVCGHDKGTNPGHPEVNRPEHIQIINCNVSDCVSPYGQDSYGIYVDGGYDVKIIGNTVKSCEGGIEAGAETHSDSYNERETEAIVVQNNIVEDCKKHAMYIGGYDGNGTSINVQVTGNTFTNCGKIMVGKCKDVTIKGNTYNGTSKEIEKDGQSVENLQTD